MSRVLEKVITVPFQSDPNAAEVAGGYINLADDGRLELVGRDGIIWRCNIVKLFAALEKAEAVGIVYVQSSIKMNTNLALGTPPGVPNEELITEVTK